MKVNIPVLLLGIIILVQLYINFFAKVNINVNEELNNEEIEVETLEENTNQGLVMNKVPDIINKLGKPTINNSEYMLWVINKPKPWEEIVYKFEDPYPIKFIKSVFIPNSDIINKWKQIIPNIEIASVNNKKLKLPNKVKLIIPARDEESALGILNLMINTFKNQLSFEEIVQNNLIQVSLAKIKNHPIVKQKIIDQIMEIKHKDNDTEEEIELIDIDSSEFEKDLANTETVKNVNDIPAYGGNEFSFL
jgi:hypothetical protein